MNKEFVPYEQTLALAELGFNESCFKAYFKYTKSSDLSSKIELLSPSISIYGEDFLFKNSDDLFIDNSISGDGDGAKCSAPLYQQAFRWFREKYGYYVIFTCSRDKEISFLIPNKFDGGNWFKRNFKTYEEAELECLKKLIEIVKNK